MATVVPLSSLMGQTRCDACRKPATSRCSACQFTGYCSRECQKLDWPRHKGLCGWSKAQDILEKIDSEFEDGAFAGTEPRDLAMRTESGRQRLKEARKLLEEPSGRGNKEAMYELAFMYKQGQGCEADNANYVYYMRIAAEAGDSAAQLCYGMMLRDGSDGVEKNRQQATHYFKLSAEKGHDQSAMALYRMYKDGKGIPKDLDEAKRWLKKAAENGSREGKEILAAQGGS